MPTPRSAPGPRPPVPLRRARHALLLAGLAAAPALAAGCTLLGGGGSNLTGAFRVAPDAAVYAPGATARFVLQNDAPETATFAPCAGLALQRFDGLAWLPAAEDARARCAGAADAPVAVAPGDSAAASLALPARVVPGAPYRVVLRYAQEGRERDQTSPSFRFR